MWKGFDINDGSGRMYDLFQRQKPDVPPAYLVWSWIIANIMHLQADDPLFSQCIPEIGDNNTVHDGPDGIALAFDPVGIPLLIFKDLAFI